VQKLVVSCAEWIDVVLQMVMNCDCLLMRSWPVVSFAADITSLQTLLTRLPVFLRITHSAHAFHCRLDVTLGGPSKSKPPDFITSSNIDRFSQFFYCHTQQ